jgi:hypothetical protein
MLRRFLLLACLASLCLAGAAQAANKSGTKNGKRIQVTGEVVDTWCYITEIMYAQGTAHHRCAVWCAAGGIPVSIKGDDGNLYVVLRIEGDDTSVANPKLLSIQTHKVTVDGDFYERDGVKYILVNKVADDKGIVNLTHKEYGVQPFE